MNIEELTNKTINLTERVEREIIKYMVNNNVQVYSFINKKNKPKIVVNGKVETIIALQFDCHTLTLGVMLESDLTPLRRDFLHKADNFPFGEETDAEIKKLHEETEDAFNGFILLADNAEYPTDTLLNVALYIDKHFK